MPSGHFYESGKYMRGDKDDDGPYPKGHPTAPVTPKMLIKALRRLKKTSFKGLIFTPKEVTYEVLRLYPAVEQDWDTLFLEVSDKLACAAAADLVGVKQDIGYYVLDLGHRETDSKSELLFWIFYKKILKRRAEERRREKESITPVGPKKNAREKKVVRLMSYTGGRFSIVPLIDYQDDIINHF